MNRILAIGLLVVCAGALAITVWQRTTPRTGPASMLTIETPPVAPEETAVCVEPSMRADSRSSLAPAGSSSIAAAQRGVLAECSRDQVLEKASPALRIVLDMAAGAALGERLKALESLSRSMAVADRHALYSFLLDPKRVKGLTLDQEFVLRNDIMAKLRLQADGAPELGPVLATVLKNTDHATVVRDYAAQHLGLWFERWPANNEIEQALWAALGETQSSIAGAALLALERVSRTHANCSVSRVAEQAIRIASDAGASVASRVTAFGIAAEMAGVDVLPVARQLAVDGSVVALQVAAIGALGELGTVADKHHLDVLALGEDVACRNAALSASRKIGRRDATGNGS